MPKNLKPIAQRIADEVLEDIDYSAVYEDEEAENLSEEQLEQIHDMIRNAKAVLND